MQGTTKTGFKFEVDEEAIKSMEFVELLSDWNENRLLMGKVIKFMLGDEQKEKLYKHVRGDKKFTPAEDVENEIDEIFSLVNEAPETKN